MGNIIDLNLSKYQQAILIVKYNTCAGADFIPCHYCHFKEECINFEKNTVVNDIVKMAKEYLEQRQKKIERILQ